MEPALNVWIRRVGVGLAFALLLAWLSPVAGRIIGPLFGVAAWTGAAFGYLCVFVGIPFLLIVVGKAGYNAVLRPYVRARHIRVIRNQMMLREAVERGYKNER